MECSGGKSTLAHVTVLPSTRPHSASIQGGRTSWSGWGLVNSFTPTYRGTPFAPTSSNTIALLVTVLPLPLPVLAWCVPPPSAAEVAVGASGGIRSRLIGSAGPRARASEEDETSDNSLLMSSSRAELGMRILPPAAKPSGTAACMYISAQVEDTARYWRVNADLWRAVGGRGEDRIKCACVALKACMLTKDAVSNRGTAPFLSACLTCMSSCGKPT